MRPVINLAPCPLCAAKAVTGKHCLVFWYVKCTECMLTLKDMNTSEAAAAKLWNKRTSPQDRRNNSKHRWTNEAYFEIVETRSGDRLARWVADHPDVMEAKMLKDFGFNWDHYEFAKRTGTDVSWGGKGNAQVELRYYDEV